jgi:hypothetical protein
MSDKLFAFGSVHWNYTKISVEHKLASFNNILSVGIHLMGLVSLWFTKVASPIDARIGIAALKFLLKVHR